VHELALRYALGLGGGASAGSRLDTYETPHGLGTVPEDAILPTASPRDEYPQAMQPTC